MERTLRLIASTWLEAACACVHNVGIAGCFSLHQLATQVQPKRASRARKPRPEPPGWVQELREVREPEAG